MIRVFSQTSSRTKPVTIWPLRNATSKPLTARLLLLFVALSLPVTGCGSNLDEVLFQAGNAASRTVLDLWLTGFANFLADSFIDDGEDALDDDGPTDDDADEDQDGDPDPGDGAPPSDLTGDPAAGSTVYSGNGCASCHCPDASGGCALDAPPLLDVGVDRLIEFLTGGAAHPAQADLSNQELADLEAFLGSDIEAGP